MKTHKLSEMYRGWFIGDFEPSILRTEQFEVGYLSHAKGENWPTHFHLKHAEFNLLVSGQMKIQGKNLFSGDIFILQPGEISDPEFITDCQIVCVKFPSVPGDKYEVF